MKNTADIVVSEAGQLAWPQLLKHQKRSFRPAAGSGHIAGWKRRSVNWLSRFQGFEMQHREGLDDNAEIFSKTWSMKSSAKKRLTVLNLMPNLQKSSLKSLQLLMTGW